MKSLFAVTGVTILLLAGSTQLPPSLFPAFADALSAACAPLNPGQRASNERRAGTTLKTLASAQADFRANDRDWDGVYQFWRGDVAGLYAVAPAGGEPIRLIELAAAAADDRPLPSCSRLVPRRPLAGYRFRAIRHPDENPNRLDPQRFAFCAFPVSPAAGKWIIAIDENNSLWACPAEGLNGIEVMPTDDERKMKWRRWG